MWFQLNWAGGEGPPPNSALKTSSSIPHRNKLERH